MTLKYANRVHEVCSASGVQNLTLLGALSGKTTFTSKIETGSLVPYVLLDGNGIDWECGYGTLASASELQRTTVVDSSATSGRVNSETPGTPVKISLTTNQHEVFIDPNALLIFAKDENGELADPSAIRLAIFVDTIAEMTALSGLVDGETVIAKGGAALGDGDGGIYYWDAADAGAENPPLSYEHDSVATGLFKRVQLASVDSDAMPLAYLETSTTLASNSDTRVPSTKAVKAYADALIAANDAMVFKGVIDCSADPNYPAANRGDTYRVSVAGKIGGGSGPNVEAGDLLLCLTDATSAGTHASVGANWTIAQTNLDGGVVGPASAADSAFALFDGTTGKLLKSTGVTLDVDTTLAANSDTRIPSQKAVKAYVDAAVSGISGVATLAGANIFTNALNTFRGRVHVDLGYVAYDEYTNTLGTGVKLSAAANITVPASKELAGMRWDQTLILNSGSNAQALSFNLVAHASSHAASNLYGVIGLVDNAGPGSVKAIYGRARALAGSTGVIVGLVSGVNTVSGISAAYGLQIGNDTDSGTATNAFIWGHSVTASDTLTQYGLLFDDTVSFSQAVVQACAIGAGMFLRIRDSSNSSTVFALDMAGRLNTAANGWAPATSDGAALGDGTHMWSDLFLASGGVINFNNGDVTVTHSSNVLALAGASSGYTFDALISPAANDGAPLGSASVSWSDLFLASGAVVNWNNGGVTLTHDNANDRLNFASAGGGYAFDGTIYAGDPSTGASLSSSALSRIASGGNFVISVAGAGQLIFQSNGGSRAWFEDADFNIGTGTRIDFADSQTTVGAAGAASALPANPTGYINIKVGGTARVVPFYAAS